MGDTCTPTPRGYPQTGEHPCIHCFIAFARISGISPKLTYTLMLICSCLCSRHQATQYQLANLIVYRASRSRLTHVII